ncbi:DnaJ protein,putative [Plasmodium gaboni]|uniref:DnaJ protein,putative n=1 Tax=Plasmodium gaboni TaxID=647221 RepID=A0ABY0KW71_9APIC|nr:DnaJ protein,putative [Plasmodium gaboni]
MRNLSKAYSKLYNKYVPIFPFDNNRNKCKKSVLLKRLNCTSNFLLTSGIILYMVLLIINLYDARYDSNFIVICDRNLSETSSSKSSGNYNERLFEINNLSNTQNNGIIYDKESSDLFNKCENYFGNFNNDDISKRSIKSKRDAGSKESNISKNVGDCKFAGRTNKVIESDVSSTMMSSLETINFNKNINETVPNVSKKSKKDVEGKKVDKCKKSQGLDDINESRKRPKKNMSTNSNNNNLSVENVKDSLSESFEKFCEDHMKESVFFLDAEKDTSHSKEAGDENEHERNDYEEEKKKNNFDKRRKNISSPDNKFEHPDTTYYDILNHIKNLSDKEKRAEYDSIGMQCVDDVTLIDPSLLFMMLFSSEKLCNYIGVYDLTYMFNFIMRSMNKGHANGIIFNMFGFMNKFFDKFKKDQENREFDLYIRIYLNVIYIKEYNMYGLEGNNNYNNMTLSNKSTFTICSNSLPNMYRRNDYNNKLIMETYIYQKKYSIR